MASVSKMSFMIYDFQFIDCGLKKAEGKRVVKMAIYLLLLSDEMLNNIYEIFAYTIE